MPESASPGSRKQQPSNSVTYMTPHTTASAYTEQPDDKLVLEETIALSDDDLEVWATLVSGFDANKNLVVRFDFYRDYDAGHSGYSLIAKVNKEEAFQMSSVLHTSLTRLPSALREEFAEEANSLSLKPSEVECLFKKVLDFILDCGVHYKLEKTA